MKSIAQTLDEVAKEQKAKIEAEKAAEKAAQNAAK